MDTQKREQIYSVPRAIRNVGVHDRTSMVSGSVDAAGGVVVAVVNVVIDADQPPLAIAPPPSLVAVHPALERILDSSSAVEGDHEVTDERTGAKRKEDGENDHCE